MKSVSDFERERDQMESWKTGHRYELTDKEILEKAIQKAIDGGYDLSIPNWSVDDYDGDLSVGSVVEFEGSAWFSEDYGELSQSDIIFDHDFAKALWGEEPINVTFDENSCIYPGDYAASSAEFIGPAYMYHLQQMVTADDPIKYLGENI